ncbi:variable surface lipoprotein [Mycoplasmopsis bovis]|uniref:variable surface lipoprotein n=1 Tax=Mycoplasmopsis bovis TaxID=28903 RepID=UPI001BDEEBC5|nr:variable surface lipoprotein [Mycoplasmopsis bovis]
MKSINKLLISAVSAISLAMPLVAASCGATKSSEQGSGSKPSDTNKPSEQGSGTNSQQGSGTKPSEQGSGTNSQQGSGSKPSDTNKPSEQGSGTNSQQGSGTKPSEIDPIQNDTTNNQTPKIPNTVGDLFKELRKIRDQYYRFKEKLDSLDDKEKLMIKLHFDYWFEKPDPNPDPDLNIDQEPDKLIKESGYDQIKKILEKSNKDSKEYIEAVNQLKGFIEIYNADLRPIFEKIIK